MRYITHHRFRGLSTCGRSVNLPYGTELTLKNGFISTADGKMICFPTSENGHTYFAINDDGKGLERGALTYAIAYAQRDAGDGFRFSEEEATMIKQDYPHFLREDADSILFNHQFFEGDVDELKSLASTLNIKIER